ncbi:hypothetical protein [Tenacibaculum sp.]|uniref:hypothetical protein n=1 Tax=Tenacibaculum sp. TaxID=1906242 RepID=UPI003AA7B15A
MKNLKQFSFEQLSDSKLSKCLGGKEVYATKDGERSDTWDDKDNNGVFSPGDTICY